MMTKALERVLRKASALSAPEQNAFARWMLLELEDDQRWRRALRRSPSRLRKLALNALTEHRAGRTRPLDPARL
jgi:hypothetical protein